MFKDNRVCNLFGIKYPIIQGGMIWVSGAKLAAACSNAGGLGLIGAGSMKPELLTQHIDKAKSLTNKPIGVNVPLLYRFAKEQIDVAIEKGIKIFFTSAGSPNKFTEYIKSHGAIVVHVSGTPELAMKCQDAGVDAVVIEGFEAGGHNSRDELTTFTLIPQTADKITIPLIAAGGIGDGRGIAAALALGADGVQMGSRFVATEESSAHINFKQEIVAASATSTFLTLKKIVPVRLIKNKFYHAICQLEKDGAQVEEFQKLLATGRSKKGMFDGDVVQGELEIGQISGLIKDIPTVEILMHRLIDEYKTAIGRLANNTYSINATNDNQPPDLPTIP